MSIKRALETNVQFVEAGKPGMRTLDNPAMLTEAVFLFNVTASNPGSDTLLAQMPPASSEVVSLVRMELVGVASRIAVESRHARCGVSERLKHHRVVMIGSGDDQRQWHATSAYDEMALAAEPCRDPLGSTRSARPLGGWPPSHRRRQLDSS